jgi:predicted regulator of Ras-like GTPase activity (Roadblock/LC7/MglB family)
MTKIEQLLQQLRAELGAEFVSTFVVGNDGLSIASISANDGDKDGSNSARVAMVMKLAFKVSEKLNLGELQDDLVTSDKIYLLMRHIGDGSFNWSVAVTRAATLGNVRMMMNEYADQIWDAIPH